MLDYIQEKLCSNCSHMEKDDSCTKSSQREIAMNEDEKVVKTVWKSAHAVRDWPGMVTIRRFSPFKNEKVVGQGETEQEAWKDAADKIRTIWKSA